jgi:Heavy metal binding domain
MNHEDHLIRGGPHYTCPMHPEIIREEPGFCPICGMALEPREATGEDVNPELPDMTRRLNATAFPSRTVA